MGLKRKGEERRHGRNANKRQKLLGHSGTRLCRCAVVVVVVVVIIVVVVVIGRTLALGTKESLVRGTSWRRSTLLWGIKPTTTRRTGVVEVVVVAVASCCRRHRRPPDGHDETCTGGGVGNLKIGVN